MSINYTELFKMCGLDEEWQAANKERLDKFLYQIFIRTQEDVEASIEWTKKQYNTESAGVRKLLSVMMKECIDYCLARDEYEIIINYARPTMCTLSQCLHVAEKRINKELGYNKYYARGTSIVDVMIIMGTVFNKSNWMCELAEEMGQTAGKGHCSEYQIWEGGLSKGMIPVPDVELGCGIFCDQAPEVELMMAEEFGFDMVFTDMPEDHKWDSWPSMDPEATKFISENTEMAYDYLAEKYGFKMTEDDKNQGALEATQLFTSYFRIAGLLGQTDGLPISRADLSLAFIQFIVGGVYQNELLEGFKMLEKEIRGNIRKGNWVCPPGSPKVFATMTPIADLRFFHEAEDCGLNICNLWFEYLPEAGLTAPYTSEIPKEQMYEMIYRFNGLGDLCGSQLRLVEDAIKHLNLDGVIIFTCMFCRPLCLPANMTKDYIGKQYPEIPTILMELDAYDSRNYTPEQYRTRLESFAEIIRMNKEMSA